MTSDCYGKKRLAGIGLPTLRHPITNDGSMGQEYLPSHFPLFLWPFFISCTRWQSIHGASGLSKYRFYFWKSLPSWFFKHKNKHGKHFVEEDFWPYFYQPSEHHKSESMYWNLAILRPPKPHSPKRSWLFNLACAMASVSKNMTPLRRVRSSFLPRLGNVAHLHSCDRNWKFWLPKSKKRTSQILVSKFPSNHHNLDGLDFSRYKKNTWPFYGYLSHQSKSNSVVFSKNLDANSKKIHLPKKKHVFDTVPSTLETCWSKSQNAHAHLFGTEAWVKCLGQWWLLSLVTMAGICRVILGAQGMFGSLFAAKKRIPDDIWLRALCMWYEFYLFKPLELKPQQFSFMSLIIWAFTKLKPQSREPKLHQVPRCHGATVPRCQAMVVFLCVFWTKWEGTQLTTPVETRRKPERVHNLLGTKLQKTHIKTWSPRSGCKETPELQPSQKEEMHGEEVWQMHKLALILVHTAKERISEAVVGIVVFASVSSRSLDKDPSWTPCGRSSCRTCWIWPMHLDKLHEPRKTWKTSSWNYI